MKKFLIVLMLAFCSVQGMFAGTVKANIFPVATSQAGRQILLNFTGEDWTAITGDLSTLSWPFAASYLEQAKQILSKATKDLVSFTSLIWSDVTGEPVTYFMNVNYSPYMDVNSPSFISTDKQWFNLLDLVDSSKTIKAIAIETNIQEQTLTKIREVHKRLDISKSSKTVTSTTLQDALTTLNTALTTLSKKLKP